jgi:hypothetical protein
MTLETDVTEVVTDLRSFSGKIHASNVLMSLGLVAGTLATQVGGAKIAGVAVGGFLTAVSTYAKLIHDKGVRTAAIDAVTYGPVYKPPTTTPDTTAKAA